MLLFFAIFFTLFVLILCLIGLGCLAVAIWAKDKDLRAIAGLFVVLLVGYAFVGLYEHIVRVNTLTNKYEKKIVGHYKLDTSSSEMTVYPPAQYADLTLEFNKDHTFRFSRAVPFISGTYGKWKYTVDDDGGYSEFIFKDPSYPTLNRFNFSANGDVVGIHYPIPQYAKNNVDMLVFKRNR